MTAKVAVEAVFEAPLAASFDAYWRLENWPIALEDVVAVDVKYDDGQHQAFAMTVMRPRGEETVGGVRFAYRPDRLELCQFAPPPGFQFMSGLWSFTPIDATRTRVRAERSFALLDPNEEADRKAKIAVLLEHNLGAFKKLVQGGRNGQ